MDVPEAQMKNVMLHQSLVHHGLDHFRLFCEVQLLLMDHSHWLSCSST